MRVLLVLLITAALAGCATRDQGGTTSDSSVLQDGGTNRMIGSVPLDRGGRPGGTGPGGSTVGGTGSAPER